MPKKHFNIQVFGTVQDVGFRFGSREKARALGLTGIAENKLTDSVYIEIEGETEELQEFINWCKKGPRFSKIDSFNIEEGELKNFSDFEIL